MNKKQIKSWLQWYVEGCDEGIKSERTRIREEVEKMKENIKKSMAANVHGKEKDLSRLFTLDQVIKLLGEE